MIYNDLNITLGHGFLPNGWIDGSKTTLHAVVMFKCYDGMKFEGGSDRLQIQK